MGTTAEALENFEDSEHDIIVINAPKDFEISPTLLRSIFAAYNLGIKELRMFMTFVLLLSERIDGTPPGGIRLVDLKKLLGIGFQHDSDFRTVRKRLERVNLLKVERNSLPGSRGGSRNTYSLLLLPNRQKSAGQSDFKDLDKKNTNIKDKTKLENKSFIRENDTHEKIINGVDDWEPRPSPPKKVLRGNIEDPVETWSGSHRLNYFLEKYRILHNQDYVLTLGRGVHERRLSELPTGNEVYRDLIDTLFDKRELKSLNFLPEQLNAYMRSTIVSPDKRVNQAVRSEYYKLNPGLSVVHQYGGFAVEGKQILALDAIERGLIDVKLIVEWDLCPKNVLDRMGLL